MKNAEIIPNLPHYQFVNKQTAAQLTGLSSETLKRYRQQGKLQKDIHWIAVNSKVIRYNISLVLDWLQNHQTNPQAHLSAIANYLSSLPSSQKKPKRNS